jgi:hypothetical protein
MLINDWSGLATAVLQDPFEDSTQFALPKGHSQPSGRIDEPRMDAFF